MLFTISCVIYCCLWAICEEEKRCLLPPHPGSSSASSDTSPSHSQWLSVQEICRSPAFNPLFCMVAAFTGWCFGDVFISLECDHPLHLFFYPGYTLNTQYHTDGVIYSLHRPVCIIFIYIYIKAQLLVKAINADHFMLPPHRSCVHWPWAHRAPPGKLPGSLFTNRETKLPTHLTQPLTPSLSFARSTFSRKVFDRFLNLLIAWKKSFSSPSPSSSGGSDTLSIELMKGCWLEMQVPDSTPGFRRDPVIALKMGNWSHGWCSEELLLRRSKSGETEMGEETY